MLLQPERNSWQEPRPILRPNQASTKEALVTRMPLSHSSKRIIVINWLKCISCKHTHAAHKTKAVVKNQILAINFSADSRGHCFCSCTSSIMESLVSPFDTPVSLGVRNSIQPPTLTMPILFIVYLLCPQHRQALSTHTILSHCRLRYLVRSAV